MQPFYESTLLPPALLATGVEVEGGRHGVLARDVQHALFA
jgi:hypothetical protein